MTIGKKLSLSFALLVAFPVAIGIIAAYRIGSINTSLQSVLDDSLPGVEHIGTVAALTEQIRGEAWKHMSVDQAGKIQVEQGAEQIKTALAEAQREYERTITTDRARELFQRVRPAMDEFLGAWQGPKALSREGKNAEAVSLYNERVAPAYGRLKQAIGDVVDFNRDAAKANAAASAGSVATARFWIWMLVAAAAMAGALLAFLIVGNVNGTLTHVAAELSESAEHVAAAAGQVAASSQALAQGASEQAASIEETSASTEEITSMTRKNAESAKAAADLMIKAVSVAEAVNRSHAELGQTIAQVNESSDKVSKIIKAIDEIAFQTNILALNAAVEAARAGEAGAGFAVVADEVRNLARRSADAAKETAVLIEESISRAREGKTKLEQVLGALQANNKISADIKMNVDEVSLGSQEQASGLEQIARAVSQMDQVTQKAAASAEESASAGEELAAQSEAMRAAVLRLRRMMQAA